MQPLHQVGYAFVTSCASYTYSVVRRVEQASRAVAGDHWFDIGGQWIGGTHDHMRCVLEITYLLIS